MANRRRPRREPPPPLPLRLLHGTTAAALDDILTHGLRPRGQDDERNNWEHTVGSNPDAVYLTDTYAFYFGYCARAADSNADVAIIELDTEQLRWKLQADEDVVEQAMRGRDQLPAEWDMKQRTLHYRERVQDYLAEASLAAMGTCGHRGVIAPTAITRFCLIPSKRVPELILMAHDPTITLMNHHFMGQQHKQFHRWLFGDEPICENNPTLRHDGIEVRWWGYQAARPKENDDHLPTG